MLCKFYCLSLSFIFNLNPFPFSWPFWMISITSHSFIISGSFSFRYFEMDYLENIWFSHAALLWCLFPFPWCFIFPCFSPFQSWSPAPINSSFLRFLWHFFFFCCQSSWSSSPMIGCSALKSTGLTSQISWSPLPIKGWLG